MSNKLKSVFASLLVIFMLSGMAFCRTSPAAGICPECDLYTYEVVLPYLTPSDSGWWTGLAITNASAEPALCRIDYVGDNSVERINIAPRSIVVIVADIEVTSYARVRSSVPLYITVMISDNQMLQGYVRQLDLIPPATAASETDLAQ